MNTLCVHEKVPRRGTDSDITHTCTLLWTEGDRERDRKRENAQDNIANMNMCVCSFGPRYWQETPLTMLWGKATKVTSCTSC